MGHPQRQAAGLLYQAEIGILLVGGFNHPVGIGPITVS